MVDPSMQRSREAPPPDRIPNLRDLLAAFRRAPEKELEIRTVEGTTWEGILEWTSHEILLLRTSKERKVWIPVDKIVSVTEGRSERRL